MEVQSKESNNHSMTSLLTVFFPLDSIKPRFGSRTKPASFLEAENSKIRAKLLVLSYISNLIKRCLPVLIKTEGASIVLFMKDSRPFSQVWIQEGLKEKFLKEEIRCEVQV